MNILYLLSFLLFARCLGLTFDRLHRFRTYNRSMMMMMINVPYPSLNMRDLSENKIYMARIKKVMANPSLYCQNFHKLLLLQYFSLF